MNVGKCKNSYITSILNNSKSVDNPNDIANIFNNFFANIGKTTEKGIPWGSKSPSFYPRGNYSGSIFGSYALHTDPKSEAILCVSVSVCQSVCLRTRRHVTDLREFL